MRPDPRKIASMGLVLGVITLVPLNITSYFAIGDLYITVYGYWMVFNPFQSPILGISEFFPSWFFFGMLNLAGCVLMMNGVKMRENISIMVGSALMLASACMFITIYLTEAIPFIFLMIDFLGCRGSVLVILTNQDFTLANIGPGFYLAIASGVMGLVGSKSHGHFFLFMCK